MLSYYQDKNIYGHLLLGLCYLPNLERLVCVVMCGKDLKDDVTNLSILDNVISKLYFQYDYMSGSRDSTKLLNDLMVWKITLFSVLLQCIS